MEHLNILCAHLHVLLDVPFYLFDSSFRQIDSVPEWLRPLKTDFLQKLVEDNRYRLTGAPFLASYKNVYTLAVTPVNGGGWVLMGPVTGSKTAQHPVYIYQTQTGDDHSLIPATPHVPYEKFISCVLLAAQMATGRMFRSTDLTFVTDSFLPTPSRKKQNTEDANTQPIEKVAYQGESYEQRLLRAIETGNYSLAQQTLAVPSGIDVAQWSPDTLRQQQYMFVCFMTMAVRAAIKGGMRGSDAFYITDEYCRRVDRAENEQQINVLVIDMVEQLCEGVRKSGNRASLSQAVRVCCDYLNSMLYADVNFAEVEKLTALSMHTICDRFREETGMTMSQYLKAQRINEAMHLLRYSDYTIADISYMLRFSSQSHFTASFRALSGQTPSHYRQSIKNE